MTSAVPTTTPRVRMALALALALAPALLLRLGSVIHNCDVMQ